MKPDETSLVAANLKPKIGSEVKISAEDLLRGTAAGALRELLIDRGVLVFRDLAITLEQQRDITASFGGLRVGADGNGLQKVTLNKAESPEYAAYFHTTFFWHMDGHYNQRIPLFGASLRPARIASKGGQTEFLNTYSAYEDLPEDRKAFLDRLRVVHSQKAANFAASPDASDEEVAAWCRVPSATQPLVWEHASGRKSIILGGSASHIEGMHPAQSHDVLTWLRYHMTQAHYIYSHEWRPNDLLIWNNTGTMHRARPFDPKSDRLLTRFSIEGEEPIRAPIV